MEKETWFDSFAEWATMIAWGAGALISIPFGIIAVLIGSFLRRICDAFLNGWEDEI